MALQLLSRTKRVKKRSKKYLEEALYKYLFKCGSSEITIRQNLNQFLKSSKRVYKWEVGDTIKKLRDRKRYHPAIKLSEAMVKRGMNKTLSDQAIHLDLIAKTRGITAAENYFIALPESSKSYLTYSALLNCYCKELITEKADALMEKMKELKLPLTSLSYNSLMTLYTKIGQSEKIPSLIQEMKTSTVPLDSYTYNVWMRALAAVNDISGVERVVEEMKRDGRVAADWTTYSNLASIYVNAGFSKKAENALKELEKMNATKDLTAYQFLITLYGKTGNLLEAYRVWRSLRLAFPKTANISYLNMIQALVRLKDLPGAEKCFKEWESECRTYDTRIPNALIKAYAAEGSIQKAEKLEKRARSRGAAPNAKTHEIFLDYYLKNGNYRGAVDCVARAVAVGGRWGPSGETVSTLMRHFEREKDVDGAEGFVETLKKANFDLEVDVFESLVRTYAVAGRTSSTMIRRLKMENVEVGEPVRKLLDVVCVE